jgi:hypothetical protein
MPIFGVPVHASTHAPGGTDDLFLTQGHMSATRLETCPRYVAGSSQALVSQSMQLSYLTPAAALTVGYLMTFCSTGASGGSVVRFGLYSGATLRPGRARGRGNAVGARRFPRARRHPTGHKPRDDAPVGPADRHHCLGLARRHLPLPLDGRHNE